MRVLRRPLGGLVLAALVALAGCDSQPTLADPDVTGRYVGFGGGLTWEIDLNESDGALTGTGTLITTDGSSMPVTITGAVAYPVVGFVLDATPVGRFTFNGRASSSGDVLTGTVAAEGEAGAETSFVRQ